jgi:hypothetical protein
MKGPQLKSAKSRKVPTKTGQSASHDYFRRDQADGISAPDLSKSSTYAERIVHAQGKRTRFTSVSLDLTKIRDFGDTDYRLDREQVTNDGHRLVEHEELLSELRLSALQEYGWHAGLEPLMWATDTVNGGLSTLDFPRLQAELAEHRTKWVDQIIAHAKAHHEFFPMRAREDDEADY